MYIILVDAWKQYICSDYDNCMYAINRYNLTYIHYIVLKFQLAKITDVGIYTSLIPCIFLLQTFEVRIQYISLKTGVIGSNEKNTIIDNLRRIEHAGS